MNRQGFRRVIAAAALLSVCAGIAVPAMASAAPSVAWRIEQASRPTNLTPGTKANATGYPQYEVFIQNVGGVDAALGTKVTDVLPAGLSASSTATPRWEYAPPGKSFAEGPCQVASQTVACVVPYSVSSGAPVKVIIPLDISSAAAGTVLNKVAVEGGGAIASSQTETLVTTSPPTFGVLPTPGLSATVSDEAGDAPLAGAHPYIATFNIGVPSVSKGETWQPLQAMRRVGLELPQGYVVNPMATKVRCTQIEASEAASGFPPKLCPQESQVGLAYPVIPGFLQHAPVPLYNMVPPPGVAAELSFELENTVVNILGGLSSGFRLAAGSQELITKFGVGEVTLALWGVPSDSRFDHYREGGLSCRSIGNAAGCEIEPSPAPFITAPTSCTESLSIAATVTSWLGSKAQASAPLTNPRFEEYEPNGCSSLGFSPTIESKATTNAAETAAGLEFGIHQPQDNALEGRATAALKDVTVTLPEGMVLNASAANGLSACTEAEMGYAPEEGKIRFSTSPQSCPDAAKVGTIEVKTPLLEDELPGSVYLAKPFDNPFGSLLAIYLAVEDEKTGIVAKLAGKIDADPQTGQLTATFTENPELPLEDIDLKFFEGAGAALTTPLTCGGHTTTSTLTPWSTPEGVDVHPTSTFETTTGCYGSEAAAPKEVSFTAGAESPLAGAYSPFVFRLGRKDGTQHITGVEATLPEGVLGKLAGISYCPEAGISQAIGREAPERGKEEIASPSCPSSSEVGTVNVTAGSGISPVPVSGHVYLAGPYKGAPLSFVVIVPAVTGPFDLGTVVDRIALHVGEYDARIHAVADPLPTIRDGIPLDVRSIEVRLNRPNFTLNPTSCEVKAIEGVASTQAGQSVALQNRFQVGECGRLAFKPKISLALSGATGRTGHPALKATVTYPSKGEYANIARAQVSLPHAEFLHQAAIADACTKPVLEAHACPAKTQYGKVRVWTPLLEKPLEGPVYLVGGYGYKLPAMVTELNGQIRVLLVGKVDTGKSGGIRNTFESVPDAPLQKFVLQLHGGKHGLLENSENLCEKPRKAGASFTAQNGKTLKLTPKISNSCKSKSKGGSKGKKGAKGKKKG